MKLSSQAFLVSSLVFATACASRDRAPDPVTPAAGGPSGSTVDGPEPVSFAMSPQRILTDIAWLADDAREGRRAGLAGERASAEYLAARFGELGLEPAGTEGFLQPFDVPLPAEDRGGSQIDIGDERLAGPEHIVPLYCSSGGDVEGRISFRGYGIVHPELQWDEFAAADNVRGSICVLVRGVPPDPPTDEDTAPSGAAIDSPHGNVESAAPSFKNKGSLFMRAMNAKRAGAVAVVIVPHPSDEPGPLEAFDATRAAFAGIPCVRVSREVALTLVPSYADIVRRIDTDAAAGRMNVTSLQGSDVVSLRSDVERARGTATNVLALVPGRNRNSDRVVVVGAHFDHLGFGDTGSLSPNEKGMIHNGADDNASGTAVVVELGRAFAANPPEHDVLLACWSGEELGLLGSEFFAANPTVPLSKMRANINMDMVGKLDGGALQVLGAGTAAPFAELLESAAPFAGLELEVSLSGQGVGGSDHQSFLKRQVPALHLFTGIHSHYHKPSDDTEIVDEDGAAQVAELAHRLVRGIQAAPSVEYVEPVVPEGEERSLGGFRAWFGSIPSYSYDGKGVKIDGTSAGSPAEKAGFLAGDILLQIGDVELDTIYDFVYALQSYKAGDTVLVKFDRDSRPEQVRMTLASRNAGE